jgi:hypothetical protein
LLWTAGYILLLLLIAVCGLVVLTTHGNKERVAQHDALATMSSSRSLSDSHDNDRLSFRLRLRWLLLAFVPSSLMLGVTSFISTDIAAVPLMWVIPLSLYLLTFVVAFARRPPIRLSVLAILMPIATIVIVISNFLLGLNAKLLILLNLIYFLIAAQTCHLQTGPG